MRRRAALTNQALYGKMPSVTYQDYTNAALIVLWGVNPSASGIHLVPYVREAQKRGAKLVVVDPRTTALARAADIHLAVKPGTDVAVALAVHRYLFETGHADDTFLREHTTGAERLRERAAPWTFECAAEVSGIDSARLKSFAGWRDESPALIVADGARAQPQQGQRRDGGAGAAVGGKFAVRGGSCDGQLRLVAHQPTWITRGTSRRLVNATSAGR